MQLFAGFKVTSTETKAKYPKISHQVMCSVQFCPLYSASQQSFAVIDRIERKDILSTKQPGNRVANAT
jgi:hypothetical protein